MCDVMDATLYQPFNLDCPPEQVSNPFVGIIRGFMVAVVSLLLFLVRIINITKRKLEGACFNHARARRRAPISSKQYVRIKMLMDEMEAKVHVLEVKPVLAADNEEKLNVALTRVSNLEHELSTTKKALENAFSRQHEIVAYLEERKKKRSLRKSFKRCLRRTICA